MRRRQRLKQERELRIVEAAAKVMALKGYDQATIREIAREADVASGTIYNYFPGKFDLLSGILSRLVEGERLPEERFGPSGGGARGFLVTAFTYRAAEIRNSEDLLAAILPQVLVNGELRQRFYDEYVLRIAGSLEEYVSMQVAAGRLRPVNVPLITRLLQFVFLGMLVFRVLGDEPLCSGWTEVPETLAGLIFDGLSTEKEPQ